jgi:hypothetical protein
VRATRLFGGHQAVAFAFAVAVDLERRIVVITVLGGAPKSAHPVCCADELCVLTCGDDGGGVEWSECRGVSDARTDDKATTRRAGYKDKGSLDRTRQRQETAIMV